MLKHIYYKIIPVLFVMCIIFSPDVSHAATLFSDTFTGTTIDTAKWTETDGAGVGGTTGNIQQNGAVTLTGNAVWGSNRLVSVPTFDRSLGGLEMDADITCTSNGVPGIGYGDPGVLTGGGESYTTYIISRVVYFSRQSANVNAESTSTGYTCTAGVPFHIKMTVGTTTGAALYINGSGTPAVTVTGGTMNNKGFFLNGHSGTASTVDNFVVTGTAPSAPSEPLSLVATPANSQMSLSWSAPSSTGGAAITDYLVEYKLSSEPTTWTTFADGTSTGTTATVTGLTNASSYDFRVSAINSAGTGTASSVVTATPATSIPGAPSGLFATNFRSGESYLSWTVPVSDGGSSITDYLVEYKLSSEPTTWTTFADGTSTGTTATVTGLSYGISYDFRVSAINSIGTGPVSSTLVNTPQFFIMTDDFTGTTINTSKWTETDPNGLGGTVGNVLQNGSVQVNGIGSWNGVGLASVDTYDRTNGNTSMTFTYSRSSCGSGASVLNVGYGDINFGAPGTSSYVFGPNASQWQLYYFNNGSNVTGSGGGTSPQIAGFSSCTNNVPFTMTLTALQGGGASVYLNGSSTPTATITAGTFNNKSFWIGSLVASGTSTIDNVAILEPTTGPFSPSITGATASDSQVALSWNSTGDNGSSITDYIVEYKLSSEPTTWTTFADGTSTGTTATVTGLTNGLAYNFRVSAVNGNGTSDPSSTSSATPVSSTPTAPVATTVSITGSASLDEVLTGTYTFTDINGNAEATSLYRWLRADTAGGTYSAISSATSINYTVTTADLNKYLKFEVTPVSAVSPTTGIAVLSSATAQVSEIDYVNLILSTGQSLSVGYNATPALSTTQPYSNLMLSGASGGLGTGTSFTPLVESSLETISSAMANMITANSVNTSFDGAVLLHGVSSTAYSQIKKGTSAYTTGMTQVTNAKNAATALGRSSRVVGVTTIHGETDNFNGVTGATYQSYLEEWQSDYETDTKAITGQTSAVPLFTDQMSSFMASYANDATSEIPIYQWKAAEDNPGKIYLVAPKYFFSYSDRHHLTGASSRWLGEYYGKVMKKVVIDHESWRPLSPDTVIRSGNVIYADFHVPAGVLAFDTTLVSSRTNKGFEYFDSTSSATISNVEILDSNTVKVTLSGTPTGSNQRLRYAYTGVPGTDAGAQNAGSAAGNLRDTDSYTSLAGNTLYNWAVHFDEPITVDSTAPTITSVSSDKADGTYAEGEVIDIDVTFSEAVTSTGSVTITLETGTIDRTCTFTVTNGSTGTCNYTIQGGDTSLDLTVSSISGTIADAQSNAMASFSIGTNLASNKNLVIDTTSSDITLVDSSPSTASVIITWTTDELSSSIVQYGLTTSYGSTTVESDTSPRVTSHSVTITGLDACTTYHYRVQSNDSVSNTATGSDNTFITTGCSVAVTRTLFGSSYQSNIARRATVTTPKKNFITTKTLMPGAKHSDVKILQKFLNDHGFIVSKKGAGSPGKETIVFGPATKLALKKFQKKYNIPQTGNLGPLTKAMIDTLQ